MGVPVLILGESGSGKSTSIENFDIDEVGIFNVASKLLPFRKKFNKMNNVKHGHIINVLKQPRLKKYVIDDSQYLMAFEMFDRAKETGYGKFTDIALNFRNLIHFIITGIPFEIKLLLRVSIRNRISLAFPSSGVNSRCSIFPPSAKLYGR